MSKALLDKARAILAHPKQGSVPKAKPTEDGDNKAVSMTEATVPAVIPGGIAPPHAAPAKNVETQPAAPIYWETGTGQILGPAILEFLARDGSIFWISTTFDGRIWWINADQLRSRKAFEEQAEVREVELIRTF